MKHAIRIGNDSFKQTNEGLKDLIVEIFRCGFENHMEQQTIQAALRVITEVSGIKNVSITNSHFQDDSRNTVDNDEESN